MRRTLLFIGLAAWLAACAGSTDDGAGDASAGNGAIATDAPAPSVDPVVRAVIDSARTAFEDGDLLRARALYLDAAARDSTLAAAWFGVFMSARALGDTMVADSALRRSRRLAEDRTAETRREGASGR
jgi:hypothetical protein